MITSFIRDMLIIRPDGEWGRINNLFYLNGQDEKAVNALIYTINRHFDLNIEKYIMAHDDEEKSIMAEYKSLRGMSDEAEAACAESLSYGEIKAWFLKEFPEIAEFHKKREAMLAA